MNVLTVMTVAGEMPLVAASQLGRREAYRKALYEFAKQQVYENTKDKSRMCVKLVNISDRGKHKRCRLYKKAIPIVDWIGMREYYEEMFPNNRVREKKFKTFYSD